MGWIQDGVKGEWGNSSWMSRTGYWRGIFNNSCSKGNWNLGGQPAQGLEFLRCGRFTELIFASQVLPVCCFFLLTLPFFYNIIKKYLLLSQFFKNIFIYLFILALLNGVRNLSSPPRDRNCTPCSGSVGYFFFFFLQSSSLCLLVKTFSSLKIFLFYF